MRMFLKIFGAVFVLTFAAGIAFAGNTGKIVGKVVDDKGQPVVGAIVKVLTTNRGAEPSFPAVFSTSCSPRTRAAR